MSVTYFGSRSSGSGGSPYPKLVTTPNPFTLYKVGGNGAFLPSVNTLYPAYRTGAGDRGLRVESPSVVKLIQVNSNGSETVLANFNPQSYLPNAIQVLPQCICYSTTDQCWYILLTYSNPDRLRLLKVDDTTGAVTAIGAAFNPANPDTAWPCATNAHFLTSFYLDNVTGHLKILCNGYHHLLNKTTGAIVSQDVPATLTGGVYSLVGCGYLTRDSTVGVGVTSVVGTSEAVSIARLFGNNGNLASLNLPSSLFNFECSLMQRVNYIDHDKMYVGGQGTTPRVVTVAEYDAFITALYKYETEV